MNVWAFAIIAGLLLRFAVDRAAEIADLRALRTEPPAELADVYDRKAYRDAQRYLRDNTRFGWLSSAVSLAIVLVFGFGGGFAALDGWVRNSAGHPVSQGVLFFGVLGGAAWILRLPLEVFRTFVIEERYGFNRTTPALFAMDQVKSLALGALLGAPLVAGTVAFFRYAGPAAWLWCWLAASLYLLALQIVAPTWILPLFNRFRPLEEGELRRALLLYARRARFPVENINLSNPAPHPFMVWRRYSHPPILERIGAIRHMEGGGKR